MDKIQSLREEVSKLAQDPSFIHHKWYVKYHLEIVEKLALNLLKRYPEGNQDLVVALVWVHDYAKIVGIRTDEVLALEKSSEFIKSLSFDEEFKAKLIEYLRIFESKMKEDINLAPIEVRIVSTADALAHMYGPFYLMFAQENPNMPLEDLLKDNFNKIEKDWNRKIGLPGIREEYEQRYKFFRELFGEISI